MLLAQSERWPCTQLGVGAVSQNVVDATIDVAHRYGVRLMSIASRRQIDGSANAPGYVNGWSTETFSAYVRERDPDGMVVMCRDHGGPYQGGQTEFLGGENEAFKDAMTSFETDIASGFDLLHVDTSLVRPDGVADPAQASIDCLILIYERLAEVARSSGRSIAFELGAEEQSSVTDGLLYPSRLLDALEPLVGAGKAPAPLYVVVQTGTRVMERRNIGALDAPFRVEGQMPSHVHVPHVVQYLSNRGTRLKQHNSDYLSDEVLAWLPLMGIDAANIAPEYGIAETLELIAITEQHALTAERESFLELAYHSGKWSKWELPDSSATDRERAIWAGHYVFATPEFGEIKERIARALGSSVDDVNFRLRQRVILAIERHVSAFRLLGAR
jgi:hypothetical protein